MSIIEISVEVYRDGDLLDSGHFDDDDLSDAVDSTRIWLGNLAANGLPA